MYQEIKLEKVVVIKVFSGIQMFAKNIEDETAPLKKQKIVSENNTFSCLCFIH